MVIGVGILKYRDIGISIFFPTFTVYFTISKYKCKCRRRDALASATGRYGFSTRLSTRLDLTHPSITILDTAEINHSGFIAHTSLSRNLADILASSSAMTPYRVRRLGLASW